MIQRLQQIPILRTASGSFLINIMFAGLMFVSGFILARLLGNVGLGAYDFAETWVEILLILAVFGFDRMFIRKLPAYELKSEYSLMHGIWRFGRITSLILTVFLILFSIVVFVLLFQPIAKVGWSDDLLPRIIIDRQNEHLLLASLTAMILLPFRVWLQLTRGALHGFNQIVRGLVPDYIIRVMVFIGLLLGVAIFWNGLIPAWVAVLLHVIASVIASVCAFHFVRHTIPQQMRKIPPIYVTKEWLTNSTAFVVSTVAQTLNLRVGVLLLGMLAPLDQVSYYSISLRVVPVIVLAQSSIYMTIQPQIAKLYAEKDLDALQKLVTTSVRMVVLVSFPAGLGLILFGSIILQLFGAEFAQAYPILVILAIGLLINTLSGPVSILLTMTEYERKVAYTNLGLIFVSIIISIILIPTYGALGAAIATSIGTICRNLILMGFVYFNLGIITLPIYIKKQVS